MSYQFTVFGRPEPQGSSKAFVIAGKARITSTNAKLKPWRQQVALTAMASEISKFAKHVPVELFVDFFLAKPPSVPKKRNNPSVKPDLDKLIRAINDALTGICYEDDGQVCKIESRKFYGTPERTEIRVKELQTETTSNLIQL